MRFSLGCFAAACLLTLAPFFPATSHAQIAESWALVAEDDFDDETMDGWSLYLDEGGSWSIQDGELHGIAPGGASGTAATFDGIFVGDVMIEYKFKSLSFAGHIQCVFRKVAEDNCQYVLGHDPGADRLNLQKYSSATGHISLDAVAPWPMDDGLWYWVRITAVEGHLQVAMSTDGTTYRTEIDVEDPSPLGPGNFTLAVGEAGKHAVFDEVCLYEPQAIPVETITWGQIKQLY